MGDKKKAGSMLVRLVSAAGTGFFYVVKKSKRFQNTQAKLEFRKYDPRVNRHVLFTEAKMNVQNVQLKPKSVVVFVICVRFSKCIKSLGYDTLQIVNLRYFTGYVNVFGSTLCIYAYVLEP